MPGMNPAFAAAIARRNAKGKGPQKGVNPFAKKGAAPASGDGEGPADMKMDKMPGMNDDKMAANHKAMHGKAPAKGKMPMSGGLPQFLKK